MPDFNRLARDLVSLHDTDAHPSKIDALVDMAVRLQDMETPEPSLVEDLFALSSQLRAFMDEDLIAQLDALEIASMTSL